MANDVFLWLLFAALNWIVFGIPIMKIVQRTGRPGWWSLLLFTGVGLIIGLWVLAYCRWPAVDDRPQ
jgi:hypothetical protein